MAETAISLPASLAAADRPSRAAALTLAVGLPGDTLLYLLLPLYAAEFGVSLPAAGVLLAANRLVRVPGYCWGGGGGGEGGWGPRAACIAAALGAAASTLGYSVLSGLALLLIARLLWGL